MSAAHTPGPWIATFIRNTNVEGVEISFDIDGDRGSIVRGQSAEHLKINGQSDDPIMAAECEANAHLIAAAPELLDALGEMLELIDDLTDSIRLTDRVVQLEASWRALRAKATGAAA